jgi:hypothetical protein
LRALRLTGLGRIAANKAASRGDSADAGWPKA